MNNESVMAAVRDEVDSVSQRSGDLGRVLQRGSKRRTAVRMATWTGGGLLLALFLGLAVVLNPSSGSVASDGTLELLPGFSIPVFDQPVESEGALVYSARPGPAVTELDLAGLGVEVPITLRAPDDFVVPTSGENRPNSLVADRIIYIGDLSGAQVALHSFDGTLMAYLGNGTRVSGGGVCVTSKSLAGGVSVDPPVGPWMLWTGLPESTAVVAGETVDGVKYWQRAVGRTVVFILPDGGLIDAVTLSALSADGTELASTRDLQFTPGVGVDGEPVFEISC